MSAASGAAVIAQSDPCCHASTPATGWHVSQVRTLLAHFSFLLWTRSLRPAREPEGFL